MNAAAADLSLSTATYDVATTVKNETIPEDGTEAANGGDIWLRLAVTNSLGNSSTASGLTGLTIIATSGRLANHASNPLNGQPMTAAVTGGSGSNSAQVTTSVGSVMHILVSKADRKPGTVEFYAQVVGTDGAPRSNTETLTFTGASASLTLGTPKSVAPGATTEFTVNAQDAAGNPGGVGQLSFKVTDADGKGVSTGKVKVTKDTAGTSTPDDDRDDNPLQTVSLIETFSTTAPGVYTIETSLAGVKDSEATTTLTVSGAAANVGLDVSMNTDTVQLGTIVTVVATMTDKNAAPVPDDTTIAFAAGGALTLDKVIAPDQTKDGAATAEFIVSKGEGLGVIIVTSGTGRATHTVLIGAEAPAPEPPVAGSIALETVGEDHSAGTVTVLATLSDADGNPVDGMISFYHSGDADLFGPEEVETKDGTATAVYHANDDFTVFAVSGGLRETLSVEVTSAAEQTAADKAEADRIAAEEAEAEAARRAEADAEAAAEAAAIALRLTDCPARPATRPG